MRLSPFICFDLILQDEFSIPLQACVPCKLQPYIITNIGKFDSITDAHLKKTHFEYVNVTGLFLILF